MKYTEIVRKLIHEPGVAESTMMGSPCLRFKGEFFAMMFDREQSLIIKVAPERVNELVAQKVGNEFNFTKKRFKEWVLIPLKREREFEAFVREALDYAKVRAKPGKKK